MSFFCRLAAWGVILVGLGVVAPRAVPPANAQTQTGTISRIEVVGNQRIEAGTVISYLTVRPGDRFDPQRLNDSLKALVNTGLFADVAFQTRGSVLVIAVEENPIINRIRFDGNDKLDNDELQEEAQLRPRQVFTRAKVRADVQRMLEIYRAKGHFAAIIEPKIVSLSQNRVDLVYEISEGPKSKVRRINFIGNKAFSDGELRGEMVSVEARWWKLFTSFDTYDPDRLAFDASELRGFYQDQGYADFRLISQVSELTPDRKDFIVTFVVDEGEIYTFGNIEVESEIRDINPQLFRGFLNIREGATFSASGISNSVDNLTNAAGVLGFAFVNIAVDQTRNREDRTIDVKFTVESAPRVYVERIDVRGNVRTLDRVIRREMRLSEGDAFNLSKQERSRQRIQQLGFFREVEIEQLPGSQNDRIVLDVSVQEEATGSVSLSAAFSSFAAFSFQFGLQQRNFLGKGQNLAFNFSISALSTNTSISFTEPWLFGRELRGGFDIFRTDINNTVRGVRISAFEQTSYGLTLRAGLPLTEYVGLGVNYTIRSDDITPRTTGDAVFNLLLNQQSGDFLTSQLGYNLVYNTLNHPIRPTRGTRATFSQNFAGLGGDITRLTTRFDYDRFTPLWYGFVFRLGLEGGFVEGLGQPVRTQDAFFIGGPRIRGFDNSGIGPRELLVDDDGTVLDSSRQFPLGGNAFYLGTAELFLPLGEGARELGVQASAFADVGSLWDTDFEEFATTQQQLNALNFADSSQPRLAVGFGVSWESPFGPFRIDLAWPILKQENVDNTQTLQFNVGTSF
ncbi:outer membrane protein assembly factor BamA [Rhodothalassium salexigens]|uniref:outer membrane protein assembly factor BamA n=1 Tax=Rhodothalassium salexigens TaxID=1086 RepID=UPI0019143DC2